MVKIEEKKSEKSWDNLYEAETGKQKSAKASAKEKARLGKDHKPIDDLDAVEFDIIPGFTINFDEQPVFDKQLIKDIIQ